MQETPIETASQVIGGTRPAIDAGIRHEHRRLKIQTIRISTSPNESTAQVVLSLGEQEFTHSASGYATGGRGMLRLVAEATASAVSKSLATGHGIMIDDVVTFKAGDDRDVVSVIATFISPRSTNTSAGGAVVRYADPYRAAAAALLSAVNRQIAAVPRAEPVETETPTETGV
jgi:hypothetical protein